MTALTQAEVRRLLDYDPNGTGQSYTWLREGHMEACAVECALCPGARQAGLKPMCWRR